MQQKIGFPKAGTTSRGEKWKSHNQRKENDILLCVTDSEEQVTSQQHSPPVALAQLFHIFDLSILWFSWCRDMHFLTIASQ